MLACIRQQWADHIVQRELRVGALLPGRGHQARYGHVQPEPQAPVGAVLQPYPTVDGDDLGPAHLPIQPRSGSVSVVLSITSAMRSKDRSFLGVKASLRHTALA